MKKQVLLCLACVSAGMALGVALNDRHLLQDIAGKQALAVQPQAEVDRHQHTNWDEQPDDTQGMTPEERTNIRVYEQSNPSVVNINTTTVQIDHLFGHQRQAEGSGSGAVLDKKGHIITNFHVVENAKAIEVTLASSETAYQATLIGQDKESDIAVLRIDAPAEDLYPIKLGSSNNLRVGQRVFVLGTPFSWDGTLTAGIISSLNRNLHSREPGRVMQSLIQTDAAMNPGNSGGPLLDTSSRMIGMCVAIATKTGQNAGVGFAIPIDRIKSIVPELIENGRVIHANVGIIRVMETEAGLVIVQLDPEGPAAQAGLQGFRRVVQRRRQGPVVYETETIDRSHADRILAVDGEPMRSGVQFRDKIWEYNPGNVIQVTIVRDGQQIDVPVTLGAN